MKYTVPVLLTMALLMGQYSAIIFNHDWQTYWTRNFLFTGLPFYWIGGEINRNSDKIKEKLNSKLLVVSIAVLCVINCIEYGIIKDIAGAGSLFITTVFLSITAVVYFAYFFKGTSKCARVLAEIGCKYSLKIYIFHVMVGEAEKMVINKLMPSFMGIFQVIQPAAVFVSTLAALVVYEFIKNKIVSMKK